ncbi:hypothetical protein [Chryseosolibacter indicus]|uniref:Uncharacterized protein n=1 Tax=Chryseosolibacter indicus TaxID=2782351 RepID=A0ABS5VZY4_9BACT|nr:hypothetical protein [Chryseosolibacter indicus]MBT1706484.1 hypothetical protein [Chryseosolibacter indicus]
MIKLYLAITIALSGLPYFSLLPHLHNINAMTRQFLLKQNIYVSDKGYYKYEQVVINSNSGFNTLIKRAAICR